MGKILIKLDAYNNDLKEINKGFLEVCRLKYNDAPKSNFQSMIALFDQFIKMDSVLKSHDDFLKHDVAECVEVGENFVEIDQSYSNAFG